MPTRVCHWQQASCVVLELKVFVGKFLPVNRETTSAVAIDKVTALDHELFDDAMKHRSFVALRRAANAMLAGAKLAKRYCAQQSNKMNKQTNESKTEKRVSKRSGRTLFAHATVASSAQQQQQRQRASTIAQISPKVFGGARHHIGKELDLDATDVVAAHRNVKEDNRIAAVVDQCAVAFGALGLAWLACCTRTRHIFYSTWFCLPRSSTPQNKINTQKQNKNNQKKKKKMELLYTILFIFFYLVWFWLNEMYF